MPLKFFPELLVIFFTASRLALMPHQCVRRGREAKVGDTFAFVAWYLGTGAILLKH